MAQSGVARIAAIGIGIVAFVIPEGASSLLGMGLIAWGLGADELINQGQGQGGN